MILLSIIGAVLPAMWLKNYFVKADKFPEPVEVINEVFWGGVKVVFWVLLCVMPFMALWEYTELDKTLPVVITAGVSAFGFAGIPEEFFKFRVLQKVATNKEFDEPMDGIVYGAVASLGFATLENIMYCISGDVTTILMRAVTAVPAHASFGAIMGYYFSKQHFKGEKVGVMSPAFLIPMAIHGFYDYFLFVVAGISNTEAELTDSQYILVTGCLLAFFGLGWCMFITVRSMVREMRYVQEGLISGPTIG